MNFSNPTPIKANAPQSGNPLKELFVKAWAGISMISLMVPGATTKDNISAKNIGVLIFVLLITYFGICGIILNVQWISDIRISGEGFYYIGIAILLFICIEFLNQEKKVREFAIEKKISYPNEIEKKMHPNGNSALEDIIGRNRTYNVIAMFMEALCFFWVIIGIIFYERILFIEFLVLSFAFAYVTGTVCKTTGSARTWFMIESIVSISIMLYILINHFIIINP